MKELPVEIGRLCISKAGRDSKRVFIITGILGGNYVLIADGQTHKLSSPKRKKLKHLHFKPVVLEGIKQKIEGGQKVFDAELRSAVKAALADDKQEEQDV